MLHQVNINLTGQGVVTVEAEVVVVSTIAELREAAKERQPEIIFKLPEWLKPPDSFPN